MEMLTPWKLLQNPFQIHGCFISFSGWLPSWIQFYSNSIHFYLFQSECWSSRKTFHQKLILLVPRSRINSRVFKSQWNIPCGNTGGKSSTPNWWWKHVKWIIRQGVLYMSCPFLGVFLSGPVMFCLFWGQKSYPVLWGVFHKATKGYCSDQPAEVTPKWGEQ